MANDTDISERIIHVALGERSYDIRIKPGMLAEAGARVSGLVKGRRCLIVTDRNVGPRYGTLLASSMQKAGFDGSAVELPPGEGAKTLKLAEFLYDRCIDAKLDRESVLLALGGGVIGDLAGFVAATFYRGIAVVQFPTTLLAMVDAAIGGKTGVDHAKAKNAIGAFHQPRGVLIDPLSLLSLPDRELKAGLAEVIKYGVIDDAELFSFLEQNMDKLLRKDPELGYAIEKSAAIKARIVSQDERETAGGPRALLNFGHTFAHAIEAATQYRSYLHGEAVAIGMVLAAELSMQLGLLPQAECDRIQALIARAGLPTGLQAGDPDTAALHAASLRDKKMSAGKLRFVVTEKIGSAKVIGDVSDAQAKKAWDTVRV
jgi:3-dehydroquinate synthase